MTSEQRMQFCKRWWPGLLLMLVSYATMTGIRSFRDFYVQQIFAAAMHKTKDEVGSWVYFVADGPGAVLSVLALAMANRAQNHVQAMKALFVAQISAVLVALLSTMLFKLDVIGGLAWQMSLGAGILSISYLGCSHCVPFPCSRYLRKLYLDADTGKRCAWSTEYC